MADIEVAGSRSIGPAVAALGPGPFGEAALQRHVAPLFARMRAAAHDRIYLANHSLGRPPDAMEEDVREGLAAWYAQMGGAWDAWLAECDAYRARLATLIGAPASDSVIPKTSAGQGLRAILNTYDDVPRVVATRGEFDSLDVILREYARRGRIALAFVEPHDDGRFAEDDIVERVRAGCDLVVVSEVIFNTGQRLMGLPSLVQAAQTAGARVLVDVYHAVGAFPVDVSLTQADFAVGGSYKYLRGGPGAAFLYVHPRHLDGRLRTLDIGWFAKRDRFAYQRPEPPLLASGGDAFLESTPPVLTYYQARAGQVLLQALGPERVRAWSLDQLRHLVDALRAARFDVRGATDDHGAFATVCHPDAEALAAALRESGIFVDARGPWLRLCPDIVTTRAELDVAVERLARCAAGTTRGASGAARS